MVFSLTVQTDDGQNAKTVKGNITEHELGLGEDFVVQAILSPVFVAALRHLQDKGK